MSSFVEVVKQTEKITRQHYSRSLYACSVSREMNKSVLETLATTLELLKTWYTMMNCITGNRDAMCGDRVQDNSTAALETTIASILKNVRNLQLDSDDMGRAMKVIE